MAKNQRKLNGNVTRINLRHFICVAFSILNKNPFNHSTLKYNPNKSSMEKKQRICKMIIIYPVQRFDCEDENNKSLLVVLYLFLLIFFLKKYNNQTGTKNKQEDNLYSSNSISRSVCMKKYYYR